jgi:hypothetical protein
MISFPVKQWKKIELHPVCRGIIVYEVPGGFARTVVDATGGNKPE